MKKALILISFLSFQLLITSVAFSQKKVLKRIKGKTAQKVDEKIDEKTTKGIDKSVEAIDSLFKKKTPKDKEQNQEGSSVSTNENSDEQEVLIQENEMTVASDSLPQESGFGIYSNFTFIPGNKIIFFDDFKKDPLGDFPQQWETNGSGEVVTNSQYEGNWLSFSKNSGYLPSTIELPENYTIEFDLATNGFENNTGVNYISIVFANKKSYRMGALAGYAYLQIDMNKYGRLYIRNTGAEKSQRINTRLDRKFKVDALVHFSIAVNKNRLRVWMEETKIVDMPSLLVGNMGRHVFLEGKAIDNDKGNIVLLSNVKISESKEDLRSQLLDKGRFSTTGIYFNTNKADIKPESYAIIKSVAEYLKENPEVNIQIIGHTDAQGEQEYNQQLSKKRAASVKQALTQQFQIQESRITISGRGETEPVDDNGTEKGRANNRRVEFVKM